MKNKNMKEDISFPDLTGYVQVSRELIRDKRLTVDCRWLLIYLITMEGTYEFNLKELFMELQPMFGKTKISYLINEGVKYGYLKKTYVPRGPLRQPVTYLLTPLKGVPNE